MYIRCTMRHSNARAEITATVGEGFTDPAWFGFSADADGTANALALQRAVDRGGTVLVAKPGTYDIGSTVYVGSHTSLEFGNGVFIRKVASAKPFMHVLLNKGVLTGTTDQGIAVVGLNLIVNSVDLIDFQVYGLRGQIAFFRVKDLRIERFRCLDLGKAQFAVHVCTFEDLIVDDVVIEGQKDGIHLGRGRRFAIRNCVFRTFDDAIALNAHDYSTSNPELGWIENGVVENCHDLDADSTTGFFCRILAGSWIHWEPGMEVRQSDLVVSNGRLYRVQAQPDGKVFKSITRPEHQSGTIILDSIPWGMVQEDPVTFAGVRNVAFSNIFLEKPRVAFSIHFDDDNYSRSHYPGSDAPVQSQLSFRNINILHDKDVPLFNVATPVDSITISESSIRNNPVAFKGDFAGKSHTTHVSFIGCTFRHGNRMDIITCSGSRRISLKTATSNIIHESFSARIASDGCSSCSIDSDLPGLRKHAEKAMWEA
ncbi:MAG: hypothetical protein JW808_01950 [Victivallales bacterium]|nr:hypothetical protein [Victivallales bacterium]